MQKEIHLDRKARAFDGLRSYISMISDLGSSRRLQYEKLRLVGSTICDWAQRANACRKEIICLVVHHASADGHEECERNELGAWKA